MSSNPRQIAINTLSGYLRLFISFLVLFFLTPYIISKVGKDGFGLWSLLSSTLSFFELLDLGFSVTVIKYVAESKAQEDIQKRNRIINTIFFSYLALAFLGILAMSLLSIGFVQIFSIPASQAQIAIYLLAMMSFRFFLIALPFSVFRGILFGEHKFYLVNIISLFGSLCFAFLAWIFLQNGYGLLGLGFGYIIACILEYAIYVVCSFIIAPGLKLSWSYASSNTFKEFFSFSSAQFITNISTFVLHNCDLIIIKLFLPLSSVALYAIPLKIVTYALMVIKQFTNVLTPVIAHMHALKDHKRISELFLSATKYALIPTTMIAISGIVFAQDLIVLWVGPDFAKAWEILIILLISMWLTTLGILAGDILQICGYHRLFAIYSSLIVLAHIAASLLFISPLLLKGVALGALCGSLVGCFTEFRKANAIYGVKLFDYVGTILKTFLLPSLGQILILLLIKHFFTFKSFWILILANIPGLLAFILILWFVTLDNTEKNLIARVWKK